MVKRYAAKVGLDPETVWPHLFRKSFKKMLNRTPDIDDDTREALMGHRIPGSRENYFDRHDLEEIRRKYSLVEWARAPETRAVERYRDELESLKAEMVELREQLGRMQAFTQMLREKGQLRLQRTPPATATPMTMNRKSMRGPVVGA